jgi:hypothetical protein
MPTFFPAVLGFHLRAASSRSKKLGPAPPFIAFRPFGCGPVARCSPIAIKAAMVAT